MTRRRSHAGGPTAGAGTNNNRSAFISAQMCLNCLIGATIAVVSA